MCGWHAVAQNVPTAASRENFDYVIRGGTVYDGSGKAGRRTDIGLKGDRITAVRDLSAAKSA
jgi:N-acyl-D-aspartate/D-glutamate deacylase